MSVIPNTTTNDAVSYSDQKHKHEALQKVAATSTMTQVQIISAPWCKRCHAIKPIVAEHCALGGATLTILDYDEMEEADKSLIKSLPTIRMRVKPHATWTIYTADSLEAFKSNIAHLAIATTNTDF